MPPDGAAVGEGSRLILGGGTPPLARPIFLCRLMRMNRSREDSKYVTLLSGNPDDPGLIAASRPQSDGYASTQELVALLYDELKGMASRRIHLERGEGIPTATSLVNDVYVKLAARPVPWGSRAEFFGAAANAMRQILVDAARRRAPRSAFRADPSARVDPALLDNLDLSALDRIDMLSMSEALDEQARHSPDHHQIVMLRFFAGLREAEIGTLLGLDERTVRRRWRAARLWLLSRMRAEG